MPHSRAEVYCDGCLCDLRSPDLCWLVSQPTENDPTSTLLPLITQKSLNRIVERDQTYPHVDINQPLFRCTFEPLTMTSRLSPLHKRSTISTILILIPKNTNG